MTDVTDVTDVTNATNATDATDATEKANVPTAKPFATTRASGCPFDPPPEYGALRAEEPVSRASCPVGTDAWVVSRYEDVRAALSDPRLSSRAAPSTHIVPNADLHRPIAPGSLLHMDGPDHTRLRRMLTSEFTVKKMRALRPFVQRLVDEHIDAMLAGPRPADLYRDFALPIPSLVICELLGVPPEDRDRFQEQTTVLIRVGSAQEEVERAAAEIEEFIGRLITAKRTAPRDDLLSRLIQRGQDSGRPFSQEELVTLGVTLLIAGHETTANMIALSALALFRHPGQLAALRADPALVTPAIEELLRYLTILQFGLLRYATEDIRIADATVRAGDWLVAALSSGNRDDRAFPGADRLDLTREAGGHLAFGYGAHQCLGQQLARVELEVVFTTLFQRIPTLRPAVPLEEIRFKDDALVYGVRALPVTWDPR
ncbi:cytochrome P450 [Streptomyces sp. NPDC060131]|uniref:cytochrome P450 n=1 Tax=unclassified Streptomyces TaxID=2593676 RepID=UPI00365BBB45